VAAEHGLDLGEHRSTMISPTTLQESDLVLVMASEHRRATEAMVPDSVARTALLRVAAWRAQLGQGRALTFEKWVARLAADAPELERPKSDYTNDIPDPIGGPLRAYRAMAEEVSGLVGTLVARWSGR
jgi:protein-tyrosine-phosphatase